MIAPFLNGFEDWALVGGESMRVTALYRYIPVGERCPRCDAVIRVAVGVADDGAAIFRLECRVCSWITEAMPDPEAE